jgi:hypothetical protein
MALPRTPSPLLTPEREAEMDAILAAIKAEWVRWPKLGLFEILDLVTDGLFLERLTLPRLDDTELLRWLLEV